MRNALLHFILALVSTVPKETASNGCGEWRAKGSQSVHTTLNILLARRLRWIPCSYRCSNDVGRAAITGARVNDAGTGSPESAEGRGEETKARAAMRAVPEGLREHGCKDPMPAFERRKGWTVRPERRLSTHRVRTITCLRCNQRIDASWMELPRETSAFRASIWVRTCSATSARQARARASRSACSVARLSPHTARAA